MNSHSSLPHATEDSRFSYRDSMSYKKKQMQYLGIVVLLNSGNFQIQQLSASELSQLLGYLHSNLFTSHVSFFLINKQRQSSDPSHHCTRLPPFCLLTSTAYQHLCEHLPRGRCQQYTFMLPIHELLIKLCQLPR